MSAIVSSARDHLHRSPLVRADRVFTPEGVGLALCVGAAVCLALAAWLLATAPIDLNQAYLMTP